MGNIILKNISIEKKTLAKNTLMLYILMLSSYIFAFITVPYQTRVLGADIYGLIGFAASTMLFAQLLIDFGFMLHATDLISRRRDDLVYVSKVYSAVMIIKASLAIVSLALLAVAYVIFPQIKEHWLLFLLYLLASIAAAILPDFLYRGMEHMTPITIRSVAIRALFAISIFIFLHDASQYLTVPLLLLIGNIIAFAIVLLDIKQRFRVKLVKVPASYVLEIFKGASNYFYSRIATQVYGAGSTVVLGSANLGETLGHFVASDKLVNAANSGISPIADSIYPYMMRRKDFKLIRKILFILMPPVIVGCSIAFIYAEAVCVLIFGSEFADAAPIFRVMLPIIALTPVQYLLGFPTLGAMGLARFANYSVYIASITQVALLILLFLLNQISAVNIATTMLASQMVSVCYRSIIIFLNKGRLAEA